MPQTKRERLGEENALNRAFWRQTVLPLVARVQRSFEAWLQPGFGPFRFDYNADRLEALADERAMEWEHVGKAPFLTIDEQREAVGYAPVPKGETYPRESRDDRDRRPSPAGCGCGRRAKRRLIVVERVVAPEDDEDIGGRNRDMLAMSERCAEEWAWARGHCAGLLELPNPPLGLTGGYTDVENCARGFVSADCGGNTV
jgi:hypothetical protein